MSLGRSFKLSSGPRIPAICLDTWLSKPREVEIAVEAALPVGYRHKEAGNGWKSGVPRDEIFNTHHHPDHVEETDYLDLYLHTNEPNADRHYYEAIRLDDVQIADTWKAIEKLVHSGKIKIIGVSDFTIEKLEELLKTAEISLPVNQIEASPALLLTDDMTFIDGPIVQEIGTDLNKEPAAVLISWAVQRGTAVLPKSVTPSSIKSNFKDFIIPDSKFEALNKLDRNQRYNYPLRGGGCNGYCALLPLELSRKPCA
ncbi:NADP-dependent oxidoreductase domain-containing protein [Aspergillus falconensis]